MWQGWDSPQNILVILAHPDDPEFFCGATIARWTEIWSSSQLLAAYLWRKRISRSRIRSTGIM